MYFILKVFLLGGGMEFEYSDFLIDYNEDCDSISECHYSDYLEWAFRGDNYKLNRDRIIKHHRDIGIFSDSGIKKLFNDDYSLLCSGGYIRLELCDFNFNSSNPNVISLFKTLNFGNVSFRPIYLMFISLINSENGDIDFDICIHKDDSHKKDCDSWLEYVVNKKSMYNVSLNVKKRGGRVISIGDDMDERKLSLYFQR